MPRRPLGSRAARSGGRVQALDREARNILQDSEEERDGAPVSFVFEGRDKQTSMRKMDVEARVKPSTNPM